MTLYTMYFRDDLKYLRKALSLSGDVKTWAEKCGGVKTVETMIFDKVLHDLFAIDIRTHRAFIDHAERVSRQILPAGQAVLKKCMPLLQAYNDSISAMHNAENTNRFNKPVIQYLAQLRRELSLLMPRDFLIRYDDERLNHVPRYLKALAIRAERGVVHLGKALAKEDEIKIFSVKLHNMVNIAAEGVSEEKLNAIEHYRWMIEEYKISVFAQELKTAFPVSPKRLEKKIQEIERMR